MGVLRLQPVHLNTQRVWCCLHRSLRKSFIRPGLRTNMTDGLTATTVSLKPNHRKQCTLHTADSTRYRRHHNGSSQSVQKKLLHSPWTSMPVAATKPRLLHSFHPRRSVSTQPTTAYEIVLASKPVQVAQSLLETFHDVTGLPWWASIILSTFLFRGVLTLPLGVYTQYIKAKVERLQPEIVLMTKGVFVRRFGARAKAEGWSEKKVEMTLVRLSKHCSKELFVRDNCHPAKGSILLLVQLPLWVCLSLSLRNMTGTFGGAVYLDPASVVPGLSTEGALWLTDLTLTDPYYILPVLVGLLNLCNIELMALQSNQASRTQRYFTNFLRGVSVCMIPISAYVPTAMTLYWATSAFYGLGQNLLLKFPTVRSALRIPSAPSDSETPFTDMKDEIGRRYLGRKEEEVAGGEDDGEEEEMGKDAIKGSPGKGK
ncbi:cytochrome c oxidase assembly protein COX18, mitochondrial-like [Asterias amurensis]|uniref:cytochrome c oxidase assembly protein COX18, mitochondrial-like n=1 Tax=Asterias amurensis TaxID=7602 RepID=UPI003AB46F3D